MAKQVYELTYNGIKKLQEELDRRKTDEAADISERLKEARAMGDLAENSEYDDAKNAQADNESRILEIENILKHAKVIDEDKISLSKVTLGALVKLKDEQTQEEMEYVLVGAKEQDIFTHKISSESPVGAAIMGKKKGQTVDVRTPSGILRYRIVKIAKPY